MSAPPESAPTTRTVRIAAPLAEEKAMWMARFGWELASRADQPWRGDLLVERALPPDTDGPESVAPPGTGDTVAVLRFRRPPLPARITVAEAEFWAPTLVPRWAHTALSLLRWSALALPILALQWAVLLPTVDHGNDEAVAVGLRAFVLPTALVWGLVVGLLVVGTLLARRVEHDPALRARVLARRRARALAAAARILARPWEVARGHHRPKSGDEPTSSDFGRK